jgi:DNA ligase (NAD+)
MVMPATNANATRAYFTIPTNCPVCKAPLSRDGEYLVCRNDDCEARAAGMISRWVKKIGVLHCGDTLIEALIDAGMIEDPADLYTLDPVAVADLDIGGRRVGGTADKAIANLNAKKKMPIHTFVGSLGLSDLIGRSMCQTIAEAGYNTLSKMAKAKIADVANIPGVGPTKAEAFCRGFAAKMGLMAKLLANGIEITTATGALVGQTFCMTGFRDAQLAAAIEAQGGTMKDSASKSLTYLIALDPLGNSTKLVKARKDGIKVIGIDEAKKLAGI